MAEARRARDAFTVRIIGGRWRGRRIRFPDVGGLRPTGDRIRETVFNWLAPQLPGARCLDLFAGSGAFGLECASRGAAAVTLVERSAVATAAIRENLRLLGEAPCPVEVVQGDALAFLAAGGKAFDIAFVDPPFDAGLLDAALRGLAAGARLAPRARVYIECGRAAGEPLLPPGWEWLRNKTAGDVGYHLALAPG